MSAHEQVKYAHRTITTEDAASIARLPVGKVICVGRNYAEHARELNNPIPSEPLLFMKPKTALVAMEVGIQLPIGLGTCHHEAEIALLMGATLKQADEAKAWSAVWGVGLALDLTLRDLQNQLKQQGAPWEKAKAFDGACPVSPFVARAQLPNPATLGLELKVNGRLRQQGLSRDMLVAIPALLATMSQYFTLEPGDIVLTGTPAGVAALSSGDQLSLRLYQQEQAILDVVTYVA